jgi:hypothetical protein
MVDPHHSKEDHVGEVINSQALRNLFRSVEEELLESSEMLTRERAINGMRARMFARDGLLHMTMTGQEILIAREFERTVALGIAERMITNKLRRVAWVYVKDNCVSEMQAICDDLGHEVVNSAVARMREANADNPLFMALDEVVNSVVARVREANADNPLFMAAEHWSVQLVEAALGPDPDV